MKHRTGKHRVGLPYLHPGPLGLHQRQGGQHACLHLLIQIQRQVKRQMQGREVKGPLQAWKQGKGRHPPLPSSSPADTEAIDEANMIEMPISMRRIWRGTHNFDICHLQIHQKVVWLWQCVMLCRRDACTEVISHSGGVHHKLKLLQNSAICAADVYYMCDRCLPYVRQMSTICAADVCHTCV